jgi:hypothetical protein
MIFGVYVTGSALKKISYVSRNAVYTIQTSRINWQADRKCTWGQPKEIKGDRGTPTCSVLFLDNE